MTDREMHISVEKDPSAKVEEYASHEPELDTRGVGSRVVKWVRKLWADLPARIATLAVLASVVPTWFVWPEHPHAEALSALVLAIWVVVLWRRGLLDSDHPCAVLGAMLAASGLTLEAIFFLATDSRPVAVLAIWLAGVALLFAAWLLERRAPAQP